MARGQRWQHAVLPISFIVLACLSIVVWHFYHVIFDPDVYPVSWAWWDGRVSEHWQQEEHPRDGPRSLIHERAGREGARKEPPVPDARGLGQLLAGFR